MKDGIISEVRYDRWYAVEDDEVGGWVITNSPTVFTDPTTKGQVLAHVADEYVARHMAEVHNSAMGHKPNLMLDSFFADGDMTQVYIVFCTVGIWANTSDGTFDNIDDARKFFNSLPVASGKQLKMYYTWKSNLREAV